MKKRILVGTAVIVSALLAACGGSAAPVTTAAPQETSAAGETTAAAAEAETAEAGKEDTTKEGADQAILAVSFGTSYNDSRSITIGGIENALREAFPNFEVRRAFTAQTIIDILKSRDGIATDNVTEALDRAVSDGVKHLVVQPTHLMTGYEYTDLKAELEGYADKFDTLVLSDPLLTSDDDFRLVTEALTDRTKAYDDGATAICFMGHGTGAESNSVYGKLQEQFRAAGFENYYVGTVEAEPSAEDILKAIADKGYSRVVLEPLMVVAGDHANNDMAGDEEDSWKSMFEKEGYQVVCLLDGLGQLSDIQQIYVDHAETAIEESGLEIDRTETFGSCQPVKSDTAVLAVSFGTSYNDSRNITIGGIENVLREAFPEYQVRRAFTSQYIIDKLKDRDYVTIDNVGEALERAADDGIRTLIVQPTHLMDGYEYNDLKEELGKYEGSFDKVVLGDPLLTTDADYEAVAYAVTDHTARYVDGHTAVCFMGHGTEAESNKAYAKMQETLKKLDFDNYYVGTVEAEPSVDDLVAALKDADYDRVVLEPLMVVAGDHANNDMAGDESDSWKSVFEKEGYEVECVLDGLGQIYDVAKLYAEHAKAAEELLK